jgi:uncharacterized membrane protein
MIPRWMTRVNWYVVLVAVVVGGLVHVVTTLLVPQLATAGAFQQLSHALPVNRMRVLPTVDVATQPLPYIGPDTRLAICQFDVSDGAVAIRAALPDSGWTLSLYTASGDNFYVLPAQEGRAGDVTLTVVPPGKRSFSLLTLGGRTPPTSLSQIESPQATGFAVIRAPMRGRAFAAEIEAALKRAACEVRRD